VGSRGRRLVSSRRRCFVSSRRRCLADSRRRPLVGYRGSLADTRRRPFVGYRGSFADTRRRWVVDTGSRPGMCNESGRPMALATMPPHAFYVDVMMSVSPDICSHFVPEPAMTVPVVPVVPVPPVPVELMVVDTMVVRWKEEGIFWGYTDDHAWYNCCRDRYPGSIIHSGPEPVAIVVTIPEAPKEIDAEHLWHHVDVSLPAGNYDHFRRCGKL